MLSLVEMNYMIQAVLCFCFHMSLSSPPVWKGRGLSFAASHFSMLVSSLDFIEVKLKFQKR